MAIGPARRSGRSSRGVFGTTAPGQATGLGVNGAASFGTRYEVGGWRLAPTAGLRADNRSRGALAERDAGVLNLAVRSVSGTSTRSAIGLRADTVRETAGGRTIRPHAKLFYTREFGDVRANQTDHAVTPGLRYSR